MAENCTMRLDDADACVEEVIRRVGNKIILGLPLGLGKPLRFVNALYQRAKRDPQIELHILTALSLTRRDTSRRYAYETIRADHGLALIDEGACLNLKWTF